MRSVNPSLIRVEANFAFKGSVHGNRAHFASVSLGSMLKDTSDFWRSKLESHKRIGKELIPPFRSMGVSVEQIFWWRDILPEFLWIDALVQTYGEPLAVRVFGDFLSAADRFNCDDDHILDGTISAFNLIPEGKRQPFREELAAHVSSAIIQPFGEVIGLYPECPMSWLSTVGCVNPDAAISSIRDAILRLIPGKDNHAGLCRALPLHRMFAHHKVFIVDTLTELIEAIQSYPEGDRWRVESFARQTHDSLFLQQAQENPKRLAWSRYFWNANLSIAPCQYD
jgi:hypothetical protein